ncbi:MAG: tyrosine-type recombinase/integrase [Sphaerochaeta sp.]|nr:tyrosine-type recombinase/integrase [Sphaerochaeta sp.]
MTLFQTKAKLMDDMRLRNFTDNSIKSYYCKCLKFLDFTKVKDTSKLTEKEFRAYLLNLMTRNLKESSINVHNSAVRFFYEVTLEKDINYKRVPHMKEPLTRPEILTVDELTSFFAGVVKPRRFAFYLNLYTSGLRISEMLALRTEDIDGERMLIRVRSGKGRKERYVPLTKAGYEALRYYWKMYWPTNENNYVFPDATRTRPMSLSTFEAPLKVLAKEAGICKDFTPHTLRHQFATHMLQSGTDLMTVKEMLGHSCLSSTTVYLHLSLVDRSNTRSPEELSAEFWTEYCERNFIHV